MSIVCTTVTLVHEGEIYRVEFVADDDQPIVRKRRGVRPAFDRLDTFPPEVLTEARKALVTIAREQRYAAQALAFNDAWERHDGTSDKAHRASAVAGRDWDIKHGKIA